MASNSEYEQQRSFKDIKFDPYLYFYYNAMSRNINVTMGRSEFYEMARLKRDTIINRNKSYYPFTEDEVFKK